MYGDADTLLARPTRRPATTRGHVLHPRHADFYTTPGLERLAAHLKPGGVFALWSDDPPDGAFLEALVGPFDDVEAHVVSFGEPAHAGHVVEHGVRGQPPVMWERRMAVRPRGRAA